MSQQNVDLVLAMTDAFNAGDFDTWIEFYALNVEVVPDATFVMEWEPFQGREEFRRWIDAVNSPWTRARADSVEAYAVGADRVLGRYEWSGEGATSGVPTSTNVTMIATVRDSQIARVEFYFDHADALKAVRMEE